MFWNWLFVAHSFCNSYICNEERIRKLTFTDLRLFKQPTTSKVGIHLSTQISASLEV